jgi:hypothetical protein
MQAWPKESRPLRILFNASVVVESSVAGRGPRKTMNTDKSSATKTANGANGKGTAEKPWELKTPPGTSEYKAYKDETADIPALVVQVGKTILRYHLRSIDDLHAMLTKNGDWVLLGSADEQKPAAEGTVEAWGRSSTNPVKGWYGLKK